MDKETLRANRQKALIQDSIRAAFRDNVGDGPTLHPFVLSVQSLRREIEFMEPFTHDEMKTIFAPAEASYKSATAVLAQAEDEILGDSEVGSDADRLFPLVEYHLNLLKIHRILFTREVEGSGLIPPASSGLQRLVTRTYEAMGQLTDVLLTLSKGPKGQRPKKAPQGGTRAGFGRSDRGADEKEDPIDISYRVSPFITEGSKKATVSIDGILWPRFV
jgi:hypothetical protein